GDRRWFIASSIGRDGARLVVAGRTLAEDDQEAGEAVAHGETLDQSDERGRREVRGERGDVGVDDRVRLERELVREPERGAFERREIAAFSAPAIDSRALRRGESRRAIAAKVGATVVQGSDAQAAELEQSRIDESTRPQQLVEAPVVREQVRSQAEKTV